MGLLGTHPRSNEAVYASRPSTLEILQPLAGLLLQTPLAVTLRRTLPLSPLFLLV
jgi:hypothetical protein